MTLVDYHATQLTGSACAGRNCAAASGAMAVYFGSGGETRLTADQFRAQSGESCVPGFHSPSGGLYIGDVIRVCEKNGVRIDYGQPMPYARWPSTVAKSRLSTGWGAVFLGDYDQIKPPFRATSTFTGDHSGWAHDYRTDLVPYPGGPHDTAPTVCWHDPLRKQPIRLPLVDLLRYWQKPGSPVKGLAGFVRIPPEKPLWGSDVPADIRAVDPTAKKTARACQRAANVAGIDTNKPFGTVINMLDLEKAMKRAGIDYKTSIQPVDLRALLKWAGYPS